MTHWMKLSPVTGAASSQPVATAALHLRTQLVVLLDETGKLALHLKGQGHNVIGAGCMPKLFAQFIEKADAKALAVVAQVVAVEQRHGTGAGRAALAQDGADRAIERLAGLAATGALDVGGQVGEAQVEPVRGIEVVARLGDGDLRGQRPPADQGGGRPGGARRA